MVALQKLKGQRRQRLTLGGEQHKREEGERRRETHLWGRSRGGVGRGGRGGRGGRRETPFIRTSRYFRQGLIILCFQTGRYIRWKRRMLLLSKAHE